MKDEKGNPGPPDSSFILHPSSFRLAGVVLTLGLSMTSSGCGLFSGSKTTTSNRPAYSPVAYQQDGQVVKGNGAGETTRTAFSPLVIQPRHELLWTLEAANLPHNSSLSGHAVVGPDGTIVIGPYGTFAVANVSIDQARADIERRLAANLQNPKLTLSIASGTSTNARDRQDKHSPSNVASSWNAAQRAEVMTPPVPDRGTSKKETAALPDANDSINTVAWKPTRRSFTAESTGGAVESGPMPRTVDQPVVEMPAYTGYGPQRRPRHGAIPIANVPRESSMMSLPPYLIGPPDILQIDSLKGLKTQEVRGPHLVRPDGTIGLGVYGSVFVSDMTIDQAKEAIAKSIHARLDPATVKFGDVMENLSVDVLAYNSKVYYVITDRVGMGEVVERLPITGRETVLDAISQVKGLPPEVSKRRIWVARRGGDGMHEQVLPVDWAGITQRGDTGTNYQILPGDRIYVQGDKLRQIDNVFGKLFAPIERILGGTLLGSQTVNSIRSGATFGIGGIR